MPVSPVPTVMLTEPADPLVASPEDRLTRPEAPLLDEPDLRNTLPEAPADVTVAVCTTIEPVPDERLPPEDTVTAPPGPPLPPKPAETTTDPPV